MILGAKEEVEVTEVDVGVDGDNRKAEVDKEETNIGDGGGLADAAFSRGNDDDTGGVSSDDRRIFMRLS
ncbi:hypothetical protein ACFX12_018753 [Malus domestica]